MSISQRLRLWIRRVLELDVLAGTIQEEKVRLGIVISRLDDQSKRIDLIAYKRDTAPVRQPDLDWEAQQIAFLNNPANYDEVN